MQAEDFRGVYTALVTPFKDGVVDEAAYVNFINWQIEQGVHGLVPSGTTGESPTMSHDEHQYVFELCVKTAKGRVPVMAGTGSNSTDEAISLTKEAEKAGADAALIATPYYNKPLPEGIFQHYKAIHDATNIPLVIYNIPARSVIDISDETLARLAELPRVMAVKDATGDLARVSTLRHRVGNRLALFSGEDMTVVGFNVMGGNGCISVTSNVAPQLCADIQNACMAGDYEGALALHELLVPLHQAMFAETNPIPVKYAVHLMGKCSTEMRLPLTEPSQSVKDALKDVMEGMEII